jgi:hypothetical protein
VTDARRQGGGRLREAVGSLQDQGETVLRALDLLLTGV